MDKTVVVSIIAKNGLDTAEMVLAVKAAEKANAAQAAEGAEKKKLLAEAKKLTKLVKALNAAETGLDQYLKETAGL